MIRPTRPGDDSRREVYHTLNPAQLARRGPAPDGEAVRDMGKYMGLDKEFAGLGCKVMSNFVQGEKDRVALFDE